MKHVPPSSFASRKRTPAWHAGAKALFADGASIDDIAQRFGKTRASVHYAISHDRYLAKQREYLAKQRAPLAAEHAGTVITSGGAFVHTHEPRKIKRVIAEPATVMDAARAFAAGAIDRAELMRRIDR